MPSISYEKSRFAPIKNSVPISSSFHWLPNESTTSFSELEWDGLCSLGDDEFIEYGEVEPWAENDTLDLLQKGLEQRNTKNEKGSSPQQQGKKKKSTKKRESSGFLKSKKMYMPSEEVFITLKDRASSSDQEALTIKSLIKSNSRDSNKHERKLDKDVSSIEERYAKHRKRPVISPPKLMIKSQQLAPPKKTLSDWRQQKLLAKLTLRELKTVFPPLIKEKSSAPSSSMEHLTPSKPDKKQVDMMECIKKLVKTSPDSHEKVKVAIRNMVAFEDDFERMKQQDPFLKLIIECSQDVNGSRVVKKKRHILKEQKPSSIGGYKMSYSSSLLSSRFQEDSTPPESIIK